MATILEGELETAIKEWLPRVRLPPALIRIPISDEDRMLPLPRLFRDLACRVRLPRASISPVSTEHGERQRHQGYSPAMLVERQGCSKWSLQRLHLHLGELDQDQLLLDGMVIADEVDLQLTGAVRRFETQLAQPASAG